MKFGEEGRRFAEHNLTEADPALLDRMYELLLHVNTLDELRQAAGIDD